MYFRSMYRITGILIIIIGLSSCDKQAVQDQGNQFTAADSLSATPEAEIERLTRYIEKNPSNWGLYKERAMVHYDMGRTDWAVHDIREAIKMKDDDPDLHYLRGFYALAENDTALARSEFQLASMYGSANPDVYYQQGQMRFLQKRYKAALESYEQAAKLDSIDPIYPFAKGFLEQSRGDHKQAYLYYKDALELDPYHEKSLLQLHDLYLSVLKMPEKAFEYNTRLLESNPRNALVNYNHASYFYRKAIPLKKSKPADYQENINKAVEFYTLSIGNSDSFPLPYVYRAMCYVEGERYDLALEDFKKAVEMDDEQYLAHFQLAGLYDYYNEKEKAAFHREKARKGGYE